MRIMGVDPGTLVLGYGIIDTNQDEMTMVCCDGLKCSSRSPIGERLSFLYRNLCEIITLYKPEAVAVEQPFMAKNARSALAIGRAQAIALLAAANNNVPSFEYTPTQIKQRVAGYGASSKGQIQEMVRLQLNLAEAPQPEDAADALATAICHLQEKRYESLVE